MCCGLPKYSQQNWNLFLHCVNTWRRHQKTTLLLTNTLLTNPGEAAIIRNSIGVLVNLQVSVGKERIPHSLHLFANPRLWLGSCLFVPDVTSYTISVSPATLIWISTNAWPPVFSYEIKPMSSSCAYMCYLSAWVMHGVLKRATSVTNWVFIRLQAKFH